MAKKSAANDTVGLAPNWFQWSVFPFVMSATCMSAWWLMQRGVSPALAIIVPKAGAVVLLALLERLYPYHKSWLHSRADMRVDAVHTGSNMLVTAVVGPFVLAGGVVSAAWLSGFFDTGLWPVQWPVVLQVLLALVIGELPGYWVHRLQHSCDGLWRFHSIHHSAPRLYWLNAGRFHIVDILCIYVPTYLLLAALGCSAQVIAFFGLLTTVHGVLQHSNVQLRLGALNYFFSMSELHRWHHSKTVAEANTNFGQTIILWDWLFGTRFLPVDREPPENVGIADMPSFPMTWRAQVMAPFRWRRVKSQSRITTSET